MTIYQPLTKQQTLQITQFLDSDMVAEGSLDFIAMHGYLTGIATGPESLLDKELDKELDTDWLTFLFDGNPDYQSESQQLDIEEIIKQQLGLIQRELYLGEDLDFPCPLNASSPGSTNSLSDWCFGFIEAIGIDEDAWFSEPDLIDTIAELILPAGILSDQFVEPELQHLNEDKQARQEMADSLIENIQNLYLLYRE
ncbi:MAG: YecA family protein [Gammaproteobacteria bacterium]|nr:YecA family protein [Gammaproteobacteria bacterium]